MKNRENEEEIDNEVSKKMKKERHLERGQDVFELSIWKIEKKYSLLVCFIIPPLPPCVYLDFSFLSVCFD